LTFIDFIAEKSTGSCYVGRHVNNNANKRQRRSIRLKGYDYSSAGAYFVTICARNRACIFGEAVEAEMRLNELGGIVRDEWFRSAAIRKEIALYHDELIVMPNHLHGIV
jgi:putative transposase